MSLKVFQILPADMASFLILVMGCRLVVQNDTFFCRGVLFSRILLNFAPMEKQDLRIVFMGTPEFAVASLSKLVENGYNVVAVVTQPDKPVGRHGSVLRAPAVKEYALAHGLPVLQPEKMKDPVFLEQLASYKADLQVVVAFRMLPEVVWAMPHFGTFNVHAALLPQYRGAAPINWAIINGETTTGVTTFFLDHHIDTGRIILQRSFDIPENADVEYVYDGLMNLGAEVCLETVNSVLKYGIDIHSQPQMEVDDLKSAPKLNKDNCRINWHQPAHRVHDFVRGLSPVPGAWTVLENGSRLTEMKIYRTLKMGRQCDEAVGSICIDRGHMYVATETEWLEILNLQLSGKRRMEVRDFINGFNCECNARFL